MALSTTANKVVHNGNGVATNFAYTFPILESTHLVVLYTSAAGIEAVVPSTQYTATGIGGLVGGAVTYTLNGSPIASGTTLTIMRTVPLTQTTVFANQGGYYPEVLERRLDYIYMALQQIDTYLSEAGLTLDLGAAIANSLSVPIGSQGLSVNPIGNSAITVYSTANIHGETQSSTNAEMLVSLGLISNDGSGVGNPGGNKVTLYTGIEGATGSGWVWSHNPLTYLSPGFNDGAYVSEMDLQNHARHYDTGLSPPAAWVLNLSYASTLGYRGNGYLLISGTGGVAHSHYGIVFTNDPIKNDTGYTIWDNGNGFTSYRISGTHTYGIDTSPATLTEAMRIGPNQGIYARDAADANDLLLIGVDGTDNGILGDGLTQVYSKTPVKPFADNTYALGGALLRWAAGYFVALNLSTVAFAGSTSGTTTLQATAIAGTTTLTLPAATDTLVGKATTDTLTNKTLTSAVLGTKLVNGSFTLDQDAVAVSHTGDTSETVLATVAIPAGVMGTNGRIRVTAAWSGTNSGNNKTLRIRFGASGAGTGGSAYSAVNLTTQGSFNTIIEIANRNSASSQVGFLGNAGGTGFGGSAPVTSAINTANAAEIAITGALASSGETVALESYTVELLA